MQLRITFMRTLAAATFIALVGVAISAPVRAADSATLAVENYTFTPATIVAHVGVPMTLHISSKSGMHGIKSDELGISDTMIMPAKTVTVTFTPKKAGTYKIQCSVPCGPGHAAMAFTVKVEQ